ncbi:MAG TPA: hypothetical protein VFI46_12750 [Jiangellaceae bacterium]|nr:hypothetical protein [Jiangellaceae bacterium]
MPNLDQQVSGDETTQTVAADPSRTSDLSREEATPSRQQGDDVVRQIGQDLRHEVQRGQLLFFLRGPQPRLWTSLDGDPSL